MSFQVFVQSLYGDTITIQVNSNDTVYDLVKQIQERIGKRPKRQILRYEGEKIFHFSQNQFHGAFATISELNIKPESTIFLSFTRGPIMIGPAMNLHIINSISPKLLRRKCCCLYSIISCLLCPFECCICCCCPQCSDKLGFFENCLVWFCYNGYCCPCCNIEIEKGLFNNWSEYKRMLNNVGWKKIPNSYEDIDKDITNYWTMLSAVYKQTNNTPSRIRNIEALYVALQSETVLSGTMKKFVDQNTSDDHNDKERLI